MQTNGSQTGLVKYPIFSNITPDDIEVFSNSKSVLQATDRGHQTFLTYILTKNTQKDFSTVARNSVEPAKVFRVGFRLFIGTKLHIST
jgi:hypothetical protein